MKRLLLCTDLDRTLIPNGKQPESPSAKELFKRLLNRDEITLAYVTGRNLSLVEQAIVKFDLPHPNYLIADVGSTIYLYEKSGWRQWEDWNAEISSDWNCLAHDDLYRMLSSFPELHLQEQEKQNQYKLSFYVPLNTDTNRLIKDIDQKLKMSEVRANLIWSIDEAIDSGLLDVLPASANKLHAIRFLIRHKGFREKNTVFAGDSGNDLDVLLSGIPSVLVANADTKTQTIANSASKETFYLAQGGYLGMNGNYCAGILEGIAHYQPEMDKWLRQQI